MSHQNPPSENSSESSSTQGLPHLTISTYAQPKVGPTSIYTTSIDTTTPEDKEPEVEAVANALAAHIHLLKQELKTIRDSLKQPKRTI